MLHNSISKYCQLCHQAALHPLISIVDFSKIIPHTISQTIKIQFDFYCIFLKDQAGCEIQYGRNKYDYKEDTLVFFAPGQSIEVEKNKNISRSNGLGLIFHPDFFHKTSLKLNINSYSFFGYNTYEALHLSTKERELILDCLKKIHTELTQNNDKHSQKLIISIIELLLNYCERFYDRQFKTRENINQGIIKQFDTLLNVYFSSNQLVTGIPTVGFCADQLSLSPNYFGDLIKKESGKTAQEYIQHKLIEFAKHQIFNTSKNISEIAYDLGFEYPQNFSRLFKKVEGISPNKFRQDYLKIKGKY